MLVEERGTRRATENTDYTNPFSYSITDGNGRRYYFVHIPWGHIDASVPLSTVLFGEGLPQLLKPLETHLGALPKQLLEVKNVREALVYGY